MAREKAHRRRCACAVHANGHSSVVHNVTERLCGDVGDSAASSAARTTKLQSKNRSGQVMAENTLVKAVMLAAESLKEGGNSSFLVVRARKMDRESARGEARRNFRV